MPHPRYRSQSYGFRDKATAENLRNLGQSQKNDVRRMQTQAIGLSAIAKIPDGGIPGAAQDGTPTQTACDLYHIEGTVLTPTKLPDGTTLNLDVWNLSTKLDPPGYVPVVWVSGVPIATASGGFDCDDLCDCDIFANEVDACRPQPVPRICCPNSNVGDLTGYVGWDDDQIPFQATGFTMDYEDLAEPGVTKTWSQDGECNGFSCYDPGPGTYWGATTSFPVRNTDNLTSTGTISYLAQQQGGVPETVEYVWSLEVSLGNLEARQTQASPFGVGEEVTAPGLGTVDSASVTNELVQGCSAFGECCEVIDDGCVFEGTSDGIISNMAMTVGDLVDWQLTQNGPSRQSSTATLGCGPWIAPCLVSSTDEFDGTIQDVEVSYAQQSKLWTVQLPAPLNYNAASVAADPAPCSGTISATSAEITSCTFDAGGANKDCSNAGAQSQQLMRATSGEAQRFVDSHAEWFKGCGCLSGIVATLNRWKVGNVSRKQKENVAKTLRNKKPQLTVDDIVDALTEVYG